MKILIIGLGAIGQRHARNLRSLIGQSFELLAYRARKRSAVISPALQLETDSDVEKEYGVRVFYDLRGALAEKPDIAVVSNPSSMHISVALQCARAGCDLFIEKPLSHSFDGVSELLNVIESQARVAMVGYQLRFHPCFVQLRDILQRRALGGVLAVRANVGEYLPAWHRYEDYREGYAARADLGGGALLSQIHEFDYLYALFGKPRRLYTVGGHLSSLQLDVEDVASTLMEFESNGRPFPVHLQQDYVQRPPSRQCEIVGDAGKAIADFSSASVIRYDSAGQLASRFQSEKLERNEMFLAEMQHFLDCVRTRKQPVVDLREAVCSLKMALAARESLSNGRIVEIK